MKRAPCFVGPTSASPRRRTLGWKTLGALLLLAGTAIVGAARGQEVPSGGGDPYGLMQASAKLTHDLGRRGGYLSAEQSQKVAELLSQAQAILRAAAPARPPGGGYAAPGGGYAAPGPRPCLSDPSPERIEETRRPIYEYVAGNLFSTTDQSNQYTQGLLSRFSCEQAGRYLQDLASLHAFALQVHSTTTAAMAFTLARIDRRCTWGTSTETYKAKYDQYYAVAGNLGYNMSDAMGQYALQQVTTHLLSCTGPRR